MINTNIKSMQFLKQTESIEYFIKHMIAAQYVYMSLKHMFAPILVA